MGIFPLTEAVHRHPSPRLMAASHSAMAPVLQPGPRPLTMACLAAPVMPTASIDTSSIGERPRPHSLRELFWAFTWLALQGFGGVLAVVQRELVDRRRWMTNEEFMEDWAAAQILPGPNVVNLSIMVGDRHFGARGALVAVVGMLLLPMLLVVAVAAVYAVFATHPMVVGALRGMGAVAAGLVAGVGCRLAASLGRHPLGPLPCGLIVVATFATMSVLRLPLAWVLPVVGGAACVLTWRKLPA